MAAPDAPGQPSSPPMPPPSFLIFDSESVPDGRLLGKVKYPDETLTPEEAVERAQKEARDGSRVGSDFVPVSFHYPVAVCVINVGADRMIQKITCLDAPRFRPADIVKDFWRGVSHYSRAKLVTFNGRAFDLPLLELGAYRYRLDCGKGYFDKSRSRYSSSNSNHLDLMDWLTNFRAYPLTGGLNLLSKILGKPGKMDLAGDQVYAMWRDGKVQEINDYCMFDTLDTYFVFLRTRVLMGEISGEQEEKLVAAAKLWLTSKTGELPALQKYLDNWGEWQPLP